MKYLSFAELAKRVIEEEGRPLTSNQIWDIALQKGYDSEMRTKGKTPSATLYATLFVDIKDNADSLFCKVGARPIHFSLRSLTNPATVSPEPTTSEVPSTSKGKPAYLECDLHPLLTYFAHLYLRAHTKTIRHHRSTKKEFSEWLHPDIVGCYFPFGEWEPEVVDISASLGYTSLRLYSFELKRELNLGNLRESFFQAVSNSSWACEAFIAAANISPDEEFRSELKRLSASFGIGVIALNTDDPNSTEILMPAEHRDVLDWDTINKLASLNKDFKEFLTRVTKDLQTKEVRTEMYDPIITAEKLVESFKK